MINVHLDGSFHNWLQRSNVAHIWQSHDDSFTDQVLDHYYSFWTFEGIYIFLSLATSSNSCNQPFNTRWLNDCQNHIANMLWKFVLLFKTYGILSHITYRQCIWHPLEFVSFILGKDTCHTYLSLGKETTPFIHLHAYANTYLVVPWLENP
jgi:hypothetical protein